MMILVRSSVRIMLLHLRMLRVSWLHRCGGRRMVVVRVRAMRAVMAASPGIVLVVPHGVWLVEGFRSARDGRPVAEEQGRLAWENDGPGGP
jgi:hypothetical protein